MAASLSPDCDIRIREYRDQDERDAVELLGVAFGGWPRGIEHQQPTELFRWKHITNPFGRSVMVVAESQGALIAFAAWMRWQVTANGQVFDALRAVDVAVHPAHRRRGLYGDLIREASAAFPRDVAFVLSTPNERSRRGSLRVGGRDLGVFPLRVRVLPLRRAVTLLTMKGSRAAWPHRAHATFEPAADALRNEQSVADLLSRVEQDTTRFSTVKSLEYLHWRYGEISAYRAVYENRNGKLAGVAFFRVRRRGRSLVAIVCEVLVEPGNHAVARRLLYRIVRTAAADYVICHFSPGSAASKAAARCAFLPAWSGPAPTVRALIEGLHPDPTQRSSWAIRLGDLDLL
ncbi:MAG: GNAT family N-acetyltransferase [Solirubrobacteraceae bacterium]